MNRKINPRLLKSEPMRRCVLCDCRAACCLYGVWIDDREVKLILANAGTIAPHMEEELRDPSGWFDGSEEPDEFTPSGTVKHSTVIEDSNHYGGTACVFLRKDHKCALQVAATASGQHPWHFKPFYCILHPLDLDEAGRITLDETHQLLGEAGSCLRPANEKISLMVTFEPELRYFLGDEQYQECLDLAKEYNPDS